MKCTRASISSVNMVSDLTLTQIFELDWSALDQVMMETQSTATIFELDWSSLDHVLMEMQSTVRTLAQVSGMRCDGVEPVAGSFNIAISACEKASARSVGQRSEWEGYESSSSMRSARVELATADSSACETASVWYAEGFVDAKQGHKRVRKIVRVD